MKIEFSLDDTLLRNVFILLPDNLTKEEAERIKNFLDGAVEKKERAE